MNQMTAQTFRTADGCNLYVRTGRGRASSSATHAPAQVLMLHSLFFTGEMFEDVRAFLPENTVIFAPDHRGQGESDVYVGVPTISQLAEDMIALIERFIGEPVHLVGSSMGGDVAMHIALTRPELIKTLTLSCCTAHAEQQPERFAALEANIRAQGTEPLLDVLMATMFGETFVAAKGRRYHFWREQFAARNKSVADAVHEVFARADVSAAITQLPLPLLLVSGQLDRAKRPEDMAFIFSLKPGSRHLIIAEAGHTPPVETPEVFAQALIELWQHAGKNNPN